MLDLKTVLVVLLATSSLLAVIWIFVWLAWRHIYELAFLASGFAAIALGILLMMLRGDAPAGWSILLHNLVIKLGLVLIAEGLSRFLGQPSRFRTGITLLALLALVWTVGFEADPGNLAIRIHSSALFAISVVSLMCVSLLRDRTQPQFLRWLMIAILSVHMGANVVFSVLEFRRPANAGSAQLLGDRNAWYLLEGNLFLTALFACLLVMVSFRLYDDLRKRNAVLSREVVRRRQLEGDLSRSLDAERGLREEQADFMRVVSHEFRTPLAIIRNGVEMIRLTGGPPAGSTAERLAGIDEALNRLFGLIDRFMAADRDAGFQPEPVQIDCLLADVEFHFRMTGRGSRLDFRCRDAEMQLFADPDMLETVMINLIDNALKFSPGDDPVSVSAHAERGHAVIEVRDRGIGVPEGELAKIGRRFFRASNAARCPGTGLGLYAARRLMAYHHGSVGIAAAAGGGTVATVRLPLPQDGGAPRPRAEELA
ncbi:HAMP domain-containing sensor histidine kinase [Mangrovicoccus sp. HB161399]|uniref:sensor histidine kinase n=1 Tax=Mangrovicoccus sp. HB161399 TaxID=2720392 RepID=UPI001557D662|nr:HAMP domain-containing sensor histidine kinase [Mangrovicoccus sp. HB161399]